MNNFFDKHIGTKYKALDEKGNYLGCMLPAYLVHTEAQRIKEPEGGFTVDYFIKNFPDYCHRIDKEEIEFGDFIVIFFRGEFHFFVYVQGSKYVHIQENSTLQYVDFHFFVASHRIIGIFRVN